MSEPRADGRGVLVVTGGSRGIGAAVARRAAADGFDVAIGYAERRDAAEEVAREVTAAGRRAVALRADVAAEEEVVALFAAAERELGPLAALVNAAGVTGGFSRVADVGAGAVARVLTVNVGGTLLCCREAVRRLSTARGGPGGAIVNLSSAAARLGGAGEWVHYAASKGAVDALTRGLAREVAAEGIRVNAVAPGLVDTELHAAAGAPDRVYRLAATIPMQRPGTPEEIAEAVAWLLSPAASYVTGAVLDATGGR
ncbi:MAG TPA: SDR family oxidoreductase [Anaeromyxobacteraceae bacterium]|nr:SDR family oxidoreductase [Anaeromyxobacteraceae bacterium]